MKNIAKNIFAILLLFYSFSSFAQLKQNQVGAITGVVTVSTAHPNYSIRGTLVSFQNYNLSDLNPATEVIYISFENTTTTPNVTTVFRVNTITVTAGQTATFDVTATRGSNVFSFPSSGVLYKSLVPPNDIGLIDGTSPPNLKAGVLNHNFLLLDSLIRNSAASGARDTIQTLTYANDILTINDGGQDKTVTITASDAGATINEVAHTKQVGDIVTLTGALADTTNNGANLAAFYVSKIVDVNNYEVKDNGKIIGLNRNGQVLADNTDYYLGDANQLIAGATLPNAGLKQKILSTRSGDQIIDIAEYAFPLGDGSPTSSLTGTDGQTVRFNGTTLESTSNLLGFADATYAIGNTVNNPSAVLDLVSTDKGFLAPRMTTVNKNAIATPATGLMVYDTDLNQYQFWDGAAWSSLGGGSSNNITEGVLANATGARTVPMNNRNLTFDQVNFFRVNSSTTNYGFGDGAGGNLPPTDSDASGKQVTYLLSNGNFRLADELSLRDFDGVVDPTNGVTPAYYLGQEYLNTVTNTRFQATTVSTDPDASPAGSVWEAVNGKEKIREKFVDTDFALASNNFTAEELTVPDYIDGWRLTTVYYSTNTPSDQTYGFNVTNETQAVNYAVQSVAANANTATQIGLNEVVNAGDNLKITFGTIAGSIPNGCSVTFLFEQ